MSQLMEQVEPKVDLKYIDYKHKNKAVKSLSTAIFDNLKTTEKEYDEIVILCIGTDRFIADSVGPLTGTLLKNKKTLPIKVMGTLDEPVHAVNLKKHINELKPTSFVIAVDACIGTEKMVGNICTRKGPLHPGKGVGKKLPAVGDMSVLGIIGDETNEFFAMQNVRLNDIYNMSQIIAKSIIKASDLIKKEQNK